MDARFEKICRSSGVGPTKLARCRQGSGGELEYSCTYMWGQAQAQVPVNFSFVDIKGTVITEPEAP